MNENEFMILEEITKLMCVGAARTPSTPPRFRLRDDLHIALPSTAMQPVMRDVRAGDPLHIAQASAAMQPSMKAM